MTAHKFYYRVDVVVKLKTITSIKSVCQAGMFVTLPRKSAYVNDSCFITRMLHS